MELIPSGTGVADRVVQWDKTRVRIPVTLAMPPSAPVLPARESVSTLTKRPDVKPHRSLLATRCKSAHFQQTGVVAARLNAPVLKNDWGCPRQSPTAHKARQDAISPRRLSSEGRVFRGVPRESYQQKSCIARSPMITKHPLRRAAPSGLPVSRVTASEALLCLILG